MIVARFGGAAYGTPSRNQAFGLVASASGALTVQGWGGANDNISGEAGVGTGWLVQSAVVEGNQGVHYRGDVPIDTFTRTYATTGNRLVVGAELNQNRYVDMQVAALIVYDRALSAAEQAQVLSYLEGKYGSGGGGSGNGSPVAMDDTGTVISESSLQLFVLDNDTDADGVLNESSVTVVSGPSNGEAVVNSDGSITYMHDVGNTATSDTFTYRVSDDQGAQSNLASVSLTITGGGSGNGSPVAMDDTGTVVSESSVQLFVLDNDADPDGELNQSSVMVVTEPSNGDAVVNSDGSITYMHDCWQYGHE